MTGSFHKGVFTGTLVTTFDVPGEPGHVRVPVLDADTSIERVLLDGRATSLLEEGGTYTAGVDEAGRHQVRVDFLQGRADDRFACRLALVLLASGPTAVDGWVRMRNNTRQYLALGLPEMAQGAVSPILRAYRYHLAGRLSADAVVTLRGTRLPDTDRAGEGRARAAAPCPRGGPRAGRGAARGGCRR